MEWVLVMAITTAMGVQTHVIPGFTSEAACEEAMDPLFEALGATAGRATPDGRHEFKGTNAQCISLKKR